ncbi:MAG: Hsp20 family protein [Bacteroidota bacterium]
MKVTKYNRPTYNNLFRFFDDHVTKAAFGEPVNNRPVVNITETDAAFELSLLAPGRNKDDFNIEVKEDLLTISFKAEKLEADKQPKFLRREYSLTSFKRSFHFDDKVINEDHIVASYDAGILHVTLPKREEALAKGPKQITVG